MKSITTLLAVLFLTGILGLTTAPVMADEFDEERPSLFGPEQRPGE